MSQERRLRNPPKQPAFRKATDKQQQNFLDGLRSKVSRTSYAETESPVRDYDEDTESPTTPVEFDSPRHLEMATPKFFPPSAFATDTGLESLFTGVFSLADDPPEVRAAQKAHEEQAASNQNANLKRSAWDRTGGIILLSFALWAWSYAGKELSISQILRFTALGIAAVVSGRGLFEALRMDKTYWRLSDILVLGVELAVAIFLGSALKSSGMRDSPVSETLGSGPLWFLGILLLQEFGTFAREMNGSNSQTTMDEAPHHDAQAGAPASRAETGRREPSHREKSLALAQQAPDLTFEETAIARSHHTSDPPRRSQPKKKRESYVPSSSLSGLSLGLGGDESSVVPSPRFSNSTWSGESQIVTRNMRSRNKIPPWERGTL